MMLRRSMLPVQVQEVGSSADREEEEEVEEVDVGMMEPVVMLNGKNNQ